MKKMKVIDDDLILEILSKYNIKKNVIDEIIHAINDSCIYEVKKAIYTIFKTDELQEALKTSKRKNIEKKMEKTAVDSLAEFIIKEKCYFVEHVRYKTETSTIPAGDYCVLVCKPIEK